MSGLFSGAGYRLSEISIVATSRGDDLEAVVPAVEADERFERPVGRERQAESAALGRDDGGALERPRLERDRAPRPGPAAVVDDPHAAKRRLIA
ncbi:MAG: hypothetical protein M3547_12980, partial [Acidobacteriota bacterium]|nr:hypothetical protein [Acidobacteriota bacterium]